MSIVAPVYKLSWYTGVIREKDDFSKYVTKRPRSSQKKVKLKLDQIMKVLFKLSNKVTLHLINRLFDENFTIEDVDIQYEDAEFIKEDYSRIIADLLITVRKDKKVYRYHIEFQTSNHTTMVIRMFQYGLKKAIQLAGTSQTDQPIILEFPRQVVIFVEENREIKDSLAMELRLPNGEVVSYTVPVVKYWKYTAEDLKELKMYALLPLQAFKSRKRIEAISYSNKSVAEKSRLITEQFVLLKATIQQTVDTLRTLHDQEEILNGDLERILRVLQNICEYLYNRYGEYQTIEEEVYRMVKTLYDPMIRREGKKEGKVEVAKRLLMKGLKVDEVAEITDLTVKEIQKLQS